MSYPVGTPQCAEDFLAGLQRLQDDEIHEDMECAICQETYVTSGPGATDYPVRLPGCNHVIGNHCIQMWLGPAHVGGNSCPSCRRELFPNNNDEWYTEVTDNFEPDDEDEDEGTYIAHLGPSLDGRYAHELHRLENYFSVRAVLNISWDAHRSARLDFVAREERLYNRLIRLGANLPAWNTHQAALAHEVTREKDSRDRDPIVFELGRRGAFNIERMQGVRMSNGDSASSLMTNRQLYLIIASMGYVWRPSSVSGDDNVRAGWSLGTTDAAHPEFLVTIDPEGPLISEPIATEPVVFALTSGSSQLSFDFSEHISSPVTFSPSPPTMTPASRSAHRSQNPRPSQRIRRVA